jgi:hypothetical protein
MSWDKQQLRRIKAKKKVVKAQIQKVYKFPNEKMKRCEMIQLKLVKIS